MLGRRAVDAELKRSVGLSIKQVKSAVAAGGDLAEKKFMECCWCLWKANGAELVEPFVEAAFNDLPEKSRAILFQRMLTIVYVAQEIEIKNAIAVFGERHLRRLFQSYQGYCNELVPTCLAQRCARATRGVGSRPPVVHADFGRASPPNVRI